MDPLNPGPAGDGAAQAHAARDHRRLFRLHLVVDRDQARDILGHRLALASVTIGKLLLDLAKLDQFFGQLFFRKGDFGLRPGQRVLPGFKSPKSVVFGAIPKTSTGKIQKFVLRETARGL